MEFKYLGVYITMSIIQGGRGFPVLHPCIYNYLWSGKYVGSCMADDEIVHGSIRQLVKEVRS